MTNTTVRDQLIRARTALYIDQPFFGILALRLMMKEDASIPTACVDHTTIYYNPTYVAGLHSGLTKSLMGHECSHALLDHLDRCGDRIPKKWNAACDYVVNELLRDCGFELGERWLYNPKFAGMTAEHIYTLLPDQPTDGAGGWGALDVMKPSDSPEAEAQNKLDWQLAAVGAAAAAKKAGTLPASLQRFIEQTVGHKVDWRAQLRRFATQTARSDYSWSRAQRRMLPFGHYLPSLHSEAMGNLVFGVDTSGSIDKYTLDAFGAEIVAAKHAAKPQKLVNIYCDARVQHVDEFGEFDEVHFELHGGGGTDFRPVFDYIKQRDVNPACAVYLTDGEGRYPAAPPEYPVLWCMTTDVVPPWGEHIRIEI